LGKRWETFLTSPSNAYRADVDGLRALAILLVVGFHAFPDSITGGFVGVDVFFVISGFLISSIIIDALASDRFSYFDFYVRRIRRISGAPPRADSELRIRLVHFTPARICPA
jgi:peptidoglycan/LPS O-acetylase OafA/YrhL